MERWSAVSPNQTPTARCDIRFIRPVVRCVIRLSSDTGSQWRRLNSFAQVVTAASRGASICILEQVDSVASPDIEAWTSILGLPLDSDTQSIQVSVPCVRCHVDGALTVVSGAANGTLMLVSVGASNEDMSSDLAVGTDLVGGVSTSIDALLSVDKEVAETEELPEVLDCIGRRLVAESDSAADRLIQELLAETLMLDEGAAETEAAELVSRLWRLRSQHRRTRSVLQGRGDLHAAVLESMDRLSAELDSIAGLIVTQQLLEVARTERAEAVAYRRDRDALQGERDGRNDREQKAQKALSIMAAIYLTPTLVLSFFGVSNSPAVIAGIKVASTAGQASLLLLGLLSALVSFLIVRALLKRSGSW